MTTVTVYGERPNTNPPHSWWNPTAISVNKGDQIAFDATAPSNQNAITPWPGHGGIGPQGDGIEANKYWDEALAYRSGETRCYFGSLIGKVGVDGKAFCIGTSRTKIAEASGELFLGFNDGVNFHDNGGNWTVNVTVTPREANLFDQLEINYSDTSPVVFPEEIPTSVPSGLSTAVTNAYQTLLDLAAELNGSPTYAEVVALYVGEELLGVTESFYAVNPCDQPITCFGAVDTAQMTTSDRIWGLATEVVQRQFWSKCSGDPASPCSPTELAEFLSHNVNWNTNTPINIIIGGLDTNASTQYRQGILSDLLDAVLSSRFDPATGYGAMTWGNYLENTLINKLDSQNQVGTANNQVLAINYIVQNANCPWVMLKFEQRQHLGLADC